MIAFTSLSNSDSSDETSQTLAIVILVIYTILPLLYAILLIVKQGKLDLPESQQWFGKLYEGLSTTKKEK